MLLLALALTPVGEARTSTPSGRQYFVDGAAGGDERTGTSPATAWRTLERAGRARLAPGDRLLLRRGTRWTGELKISATGTKARPIVVDAYGRGASPLVQGGGCVVLAGSYITVRNLAVDGCSWAGFDLRGSFERVERNAASHNVAGVFVHAGSTGNTIVTNRLVDNNRMSVLTPNGDDDSGAFGVLLNGDDNVIAYNRITGSDAFSYDYGRDGAAIEIYGGRNNVIHHNLALDNKDFSELGNSRASHNTYAYNVVSSRLPESTFLVTRGARSGYGPVSATRVVNNTVVLTGSSSEGFVCHAGCGPEILTMRNNIVQAVRKVGYADAPFDEDYDLFFGGERQFTQGAHSIVRDPGFVNAATRDFRLRQRSPAIDRGAVLEGFPFDFDRRVTPRDGDGDGARTPDIGAYEYAATLSR